jgi:hypothetical protein
VTKALIGQQSQQKIKGLISSVYSVTLILISPVELLVMTPIGWMLEINLGLVL